MSAWEACLVMSLLSISHQPTMDYINLCSSYSFAVWQQIRQNAFPTTYWWNVHKREIARTSPANQVGPPFQEASNTTLRCKPGCMEHIHIYIYVGIIQNVPGRTIGEIKLLFGTFQGGGSHLMVLLFLVFTIFLNIPNWFFDSQGIIHLKNKKHVPNPPIFWFPVSSYCFHMFFCQLAFINGWQGCWSFEQEMQKNNVGGISIWYVRSEGFDFWPKVYIKSLCNFPPPWLPFRRLSRFFGVMMNFIKIHQRSFNYPYWG